LRKRHSYLLLCSGFYPISTVYTKFMTRSKVRKSLNFSKHPSAHDRQSFINALLYNFHHFHRSLSIKTEQGLMKRTPAQAAGIATKRFSVLELLRLNPIAC
jgi:hypothetical protein